MPPYAEEPDEVMAAIVQHLTGSLVHALVQEVATLKKRLAPVLWICINCGAPNTTPRMLWDHMWQHLPSHCKNCHCVQYVEHLQQFDPCDTVEPEP